MNEADFSGMKELVNEAKHSFGTNAESNTELLERLNELELALENVGWVAFGANNQYQEFSRQGLLTIMRLARLYYLKNPLIRRGINISTFYVFGRGINIRAKEPILNDVIQAFRDDKNNKRVLTGLQANKQADIDLSVDGNLYLVLFTEPNIGSVRLGVIPAWQIVDVIKDPNNSHRILYYRREWVENINLELIDPTTNLRDMNSRVLYYRAYDYLNSDVQLSGVDVDENAVIYHIKVGGFGDWSFGISDVYAAQDWAKAYKQFLENWASIIQSLARFAWRKKTAASSNAIAVAKAKLTTALSTSNVVDRNPPSTTGGVSIEAPGEDLDPIKTAGATTSAVEGKPLQLMVAAAFGLPDTFFGNTDTGNLATAESLDRPTELQFTNRQELWKEIYKELIEFVEYQAVVAPNGPLRSIATVNINQYGESVIEFDDNVSDHVDIDFPPILERNTLQYIQAIVQAATLNGQQPTLLHDLRWLASTMLTALGFDDTDELVDQLYPQNADGTVNDLNTINQAVESFRSAMVDFRESLLEYVTQPTNNGKLATETTRSNGKG